MESDSYKLRKNYLTEICMLKESITLINSTKNKKLIDQYKRSLNVQYFDATSGMESQLINLLNEKINIVKNQAEEEIAEKDKLIADQ